MTRLRYAKTIPSLLKGAETLLLLAPNRILDDGSFLQELPEELMRLALELQQDASPGRSGCVGSTLTGTEPRRLSLGTLPDERSRHNSPARPTAIRRAVSQSRIGSSPAGAILLVLEDEAHFLPAANAIARALPTFDGRGTKPSKRTITIAAYVPEKGMLTADKALKITLEASRDAAHMVDMPAADLTPASFHKQAWAWLKDERVKKKVITGDALLRAGLGGVHAVGRTAPVAPRMLIATYTPAKKSSQHIALVGKGVTYDTGGLSLKGRTGMCGMKSDMGGAAAVLGAMRVLVECKTKMKVSMVIPLAENSIGSNAYRPDDILTMHSGLTVEINNTDAEGRLLLADGVSYAGRVLGCDTIIDAATLTGAQLVATGKGHAAVISNDAELEQTVVASGLRSGDLSFPLPFAPEFYRSEFRSKVAHMKNSVADRANAQASCAAEFVHWHLDGVDAKWAHVDLAGPAFNEGRGTGFGVALLAEAVRSI
ncbi:MAG: putative aminopeptidase NPEPL1 [Planctomycetota bacterium]|jgi:probable aminopeptidase NPEPL1